MKQQIAYYENKLKYETDSWDLFDGLSKNENIIEGKRGQTGKTVVCGC